MSRANGKIERTRLDMQEKVAKRQLAHENYILAKAKYEEAGALEAEAVEEWLQAVDRGIVE